MPRSVRARAREIERANAKLEHRFSARRPTRRWPAELGITIDEFQESLLQISHSSIVALDELWNVSDSSGDSVVADRHDRGPRRPRPARSLDQGELKDRIADAIAALPEREKLVIALYYYENLTLREIGEVLGVTESRVSQLHTKAVLRLKGRLRDEIEPAIIGWPGFRVGRRSGADAPGPAALVDAQGRRLLSATRSRRRVPSSAARPCVRLRRPWYHVWPPTKRQSPTRRVRARGGAPLAGFPPPSAGSTKAR